MRFQRAHYPVVNSGSAPCFGRDAGAGDKAGKTGGVRVITLVHHDPDVSRSFVQTILRERRELPKPIRQVIASYTIMLTSLLVRALPHLKGVAVQGHGAGLRWDHCVGRCDWENREIHVAEKFVPRIIRWQNIEDAQAKTDHEAVDEATALANLMTTRNPSQVFRHEVGHAVDADQDHLSQTPKFRESVRADLERLTPSARRHLVHIFPEESLDNPDAHVLREIYAELFAEWLQWHEVFWGAFLLHYFPDTVAVMTEGLKARYDLE